LRPGREQRMCSGCGSKAWGEEKVFISGAMKFIIFSLKVPKSL